MRRLAILLVLTLPAFAQESTRVMIPDVPPIQGPDCTADSLTRALNAGAGAGLPDHYLPGFSGVAFLATTCTNACLCRDFREVYVRARAAVEDLGFRIEYLDGGKTPAGEAWEKMKSAIDLGWPAVGFNVVGGFEDVPIVGYDLEKDEVWAMGTDGGKDPRVASLSKWRSEPVYGFVVTGRSDVPADRRALERDRLVAAAAGVERPLIEGG